jgi:hypothetical protein
VADSLEALDRASCDVLGQLANRAAELTSSPRAAARE